MGDASPPRELILAIIPFPEPTELIEKIKKKHPNVDFAYVQRAFSPKAITDAVPDGTFPCLLREKHC